MEKAIELMVWLTESEFDGVSFNGLPLVKTLKKLTPDQIRTEETYEGYSVWAVVLHLLYWKYFLAKQLGGSGGVDPFPYEEKDWPSLPENRSDESWEKCLDDLTLAHRSYIDALSRFPPERLNDEFEAYHCSFGQAFAWMATHDCYHVAQIRNMGLKDLKLD